MPNEACVYHGPNLLLLLVVLNEQSYRGCAIGKGQQAAKTEIEKYKLFDMPCREAMKYVAKM